MALSSSNGLDKQNLPHTSCEHWTANVSCLYAEQEMGCTGSPSYAGPQVSDCIPSSASLKVGSPHLKPKWSPSGPGMSLGTQLQDPAGACSAPDRVGVLGG